MRAMVLSETKTAGPALREMEWPKPEPGSGEILVQIHACAVCRTDLHVVDGDLPDPKLPLVPGHQIVGRVVDRGANAHRYEISDRIGIPWLAWTDGTCRYCQSGQENLCDSAQFTGYTRDGGYAEFTVADERFCVPIPDVYGDVEAAPLLCAGMIGFRSLRKTGNAQRLGIFGFGAAAVLITQVAVYEGREVYVFTRSRQNQEFARSLGVFEVADSEDSPGEKLDAAIIFAPSGAVVPPALKAVRKGGIVVCGGIHMTDIPQFPYELLWGERILCSVANLTRQDAEDFMSIAAQVPVKTFFETFPLSEANRALELFRNGQIRGSAVLTL
ncbi:MAG TPA: zinc-dependent alcohol dehydrogenase family protein [Terriglobia bacterium]|nr:zinc-dependent alcohol dehydrogenase family protein [Terriglobia bacterium]